MCDESELQVFEASLLAWHKEQGEEGHTLLADDEPHHPVKVIVAVDREGGS